MKNTLYVLLITGLFLSCKSNTKQEVKDSTNTIKPGVDQTQDLIRKFKTIIQGVWVEKDYVDKVIKTKSPLAAEDEIGDITTMYINTDHIHGDSIIVAMGDNHEGSERILKFQPGKTSSTIKFGSGELGYLIEKGDTILLVSWFNDQKKKNVITKYSKALNKQHDNNLGQGLNYVINKGLIAGNYTLADSTGGIFQINFSDYGKVSGFSDFKSYEINIDLNEEPMDNLDEIIFFDMDNKNNKSYSFKIEADTLNLYNTYPNNDSTQLILGKRVYKLVKQK